jgi:hypothetical protein
LEIVGTGTQVGNVFAALGKNFFIVSIQTRHYYDIMLIKAMVKKCLDCK